MQVEAQTLEVILALSQPARSPTYIWGCNPLTQVWKWISNLDYTQPEENQVRYNSGETTLWSRPEYTSYEAKWLKFEKQGIG